MSIRENIINIQNNLPKDVNLIAVSKTRSAEEIMEAYDAGIRDFGENKVQELVRKYEELPKDIRWHLIGHLQKNKIKYIREKVHLIHSLDSVELLLELEKKLQDQELPVNVLVEVNIGREQSKSGVFEENLEELIRKCEECSKIKIQGLMAIIPIGDEQSCSNYFKKMKLIYDNLKIREFKNISMNFLSMGMSGDYQIAIEQGSNMVRIGEGIFGKRTYNNKQEDV